MKCRFCKREIEDNSIFCNWCGKKQLKEKKADGAIKVPEPKQLPSGSWRIYLRAEQQSITEDTKDLCETKARAFRAGFLEQQKKLPAVTWSKAIDAYIADRSESLSPETVRGYRVIQRNRFQNIMKKPISTQINWQAEINTALSGLSDKSVKNAWGLMTVIMRVNEIPVPRVLFPVPEKNEREFLDPQQIIAFCEAAKGDTCEMAMLLGLHSLRMSEIRALRFPDSFDMKNGSIIVSGAVVRDEHNKEVFKQRNKTRQSARTVPIMIPRLREMLEAQSKDGYIVTQANSTINRHIRTIAERQGLPNITEHCLRHSFASLGYHLRLSEIEVMSMGGWSDSSTVHDIYLHLAQRDRLKAENKMAKFYRTAEKLPPPQAKTGDKR